MHEFRLSSNEKYPFCWLLLRQSVLKVQAGKKLSDEVGLCLVENTDLTKMKSAVMK